jgi:hypothetical protein
MFNRRKLTLEEAADLVDADMVIFGVETDENTQYIADLNKLKVGNAYFVKEVTDFNSIDGRGIKKPNVIIKLTTGAELGYEWFKQI